MQQKNISPPNDSENHNAVTVAEVKIASSQVVSHENATDEGTISLTNKETKGDIHSLVNKAAFTL